MVTKKTRRKPAQQRNEKQQHQQTSKQEDRGQSSATKAETAAVSTAAAAATTWYWSRGKGKGGASSSSLPGQVGVVEHNKKPAGMGQSASTGGEHGDASDAALPDDVVTAEVISKQLLHKHEPQQQLPDLAELSDHLLERIKNMDLVVARDNSSSSGRKGRLASPSSRQGPESPTTTVSSVNRTEPTTRSSSPDPSEEGQEVVVHHRHVNGNNSSVDARRLRGGRFEGAEEAAGALAEDLSSVDTTGADVLVSTPPSSPVIPEPLSPVVPALSARMLTRRRRSRSPQDKNELSVLQKLSFLEEKKDEDAMASAVPPLTHARTPVDGGAESHDSSVTQKSEASSDESTADEFYKDDEDEDEPATKASSPAHHYGGVGVVAAVTPAREHYRRPSNDVVSSSDSGYFTATQSSDQYHRRGGPHASPTLTQPSDTDDDDNDEERHEVDRRKLIVEGFPPQARLEEDQAVSVTRLKHRSASPEGRSGDLVGSSAPPGPTSSGPSPRIPAVKRRSDYDSVLASLHSSWTFESARIRLAPSVEEKDGSALTAVTSSVTARVPASALSAHKALLQSLSSGSSDDHGHSETSQDELPETIMSFSVSMGNVNVGPTVGSLAVGESARRNESLDCLPAVESTANATVLTDNAGNKVRSESLPDEDEAEDEEDEVKKTEPHWLLRSISGDERHDEAQAGVDVDPDDASRESQSASMDQQPNVTVNEHDDEPRAGRDDGDDNNDEASTCSSNPTTCHSYLSPSDTLPTHQTPLDDNNPITSNGDSEMVEAEESDGIVGGTGASNSPLVASVSPKSEPDYVLSMARANNSANLHGATSGQSPSMDRTSHASEAMETKPEPFQLVEGIAPPVSTENQDSPDSKMNDETDRVDGAPDASQVLASTEPLDPTRMEGSYVALDATEANLSATKRPIHLEAGAIAAAAAAIRGNLVKAERKPTDPQKVVVKTIEGSPTLAERKASLYMPKKSGKRDPEQVLQLKERPLLSIESEDECDDADDDNNDLSHLSPRQLDRSLAASRSRSLVSCDSRSITSELVGTPPVSPMPTVQILKTDASHRQKPVAPSLSLRDGLKRQDSEPVPRVVGKESETLSTLSLTSLHTPSTSTSPTIFRTTPLSFSKRPPSDPKGMSDLIRLDLWSRDPAVVESALKDLVGFAADNKNHGTMARTGGLLAVVRAMETHMDQAGVQVQACRCLEKLALDHDNELAIGEVGGVEAILGSMMSHGEDPDVQEAGWAALWNLTCGNADSQMVVDAAGGIEALVQCMVRHAEHPEVQKNACGTLANLCLDKEERLTALAQAGGFVAISMALQTHWKHPDVRNEASYALTILLGPRAETYDVPVAHAPQQR
jgi:hypothetical protein